MDCSESELRMKRLEKSRLRCSSERRINAYPLAKDSNGGADVPWQLH
jgi:hypothetical protein